MVEAVALGRVLVGGDGYGLGLTLALGLFLFLGWLQTGLLLDKLGLDEILLVDDSG